MNEAAILDFMPEGSPVVQIVPGAAHEDVLLEAQKRLIMLKDCMVIMSENQNLLNLAPEYSSLFLSWGQVAHEVSVMVEFVRTGAENKSANRKRSSFQHAVCAGGDHA